MQHARHSKLRRFTYLPYPSVQGKGLGQQWTHAPDRPGSRPAVTFNLDLVSIGLGIPRGGVGSPLFPFGCHITYAQNTKITRQHLPATVRGTVFQAKLTFFTRTHWVFLQNYIKLCMYLKFNNNFVISWLYIRVSELMKKVQVESLVYKNVKINSYH